MIGVELPADYSNVLIIVGVMLGFVAFMKTITVTDLNDSKLFKLMGIVNRLVGRKEKLAERRMGLELGVRPGFFSMRLAMWNLWPHLKEDEDLCGFIKPGEWQCMCGKLKCETFGNLCEAVGGVDATPPVQLLPDRKAAIAHTKSKS